MKLLTLLFMCFFLVSCKEGEWGKEVKNFAEKNTRPLSEQFATKDFIQKWHQVHESGYQSLVIQMEMIKIRLNLIPLIDIKGEGKNTQELFKHLQLNKIRIYSCRWERPAPSLQYTH